MDDQAKIKGVLEILDANPCHHLAPEQREECVICDIREVLTGTRQDQVE